MKIIYYKNEIFTYLRTRMCMVIPICTHTKHDDLSHLKVIYIVGLYRSNMTRSLISDARQNLNK